MKWFFRTLNRIHIFIYRASSGRVWGRMFGSPVLLLTTTGRKTGKARTVPIVYVRDGEKYGVIASDAPAWAANLRGNPEATIEVRGQTYSVRGREAAGDEAAQLWAKMVAQSPAFGSFEGRGGHVVMVLEPVNG